MTGTYQAIIGYIAGDNQTGHEMGTIAVVAGLSAIAVGGVLFVLGCWFAALFFVSWKPGCFWYVQLLPIVAPFIDGWWTEEGLAYRRKAIVFFASSAPFLATFVYIVDRYGPLLPK